MRPVKMSGEMLVWLFVWSQVHMFHVTATSSSLVRQNLEWFTFLLPASWKKAVKRVLLNKTIILRTTS